jgi:uncharacterized membrane protein
MPRPQPKDFSFWGNLTRSTLIHAFGIEGLIALLISVPAIYLSHEHLSTNERVSIANDMLATTTGILGVIFASFAIVAALMSDSYVRLLNKKEGRLKQFYSIFIIVIGFAVCSIALAISYKATAEHLPTQYEAPLFFASLFCFLYTLFNVVALARNIFGHGVTRAALLQKEDELRREID